MPVLVAVWAVCTANLDVNHRFVCYKSCFIKVSACARTHAGMHTQTMFPNYTQKQISFSHKWYVLQIKNVSTYSTRVQIWTCDMLILYLIYHQQQGHFTGFTDLHNTTQKQTTHMQRHIPPPLCVSILCLCCQYIVSNCIRWYSSSLNKSTYTSTVHVLFLRWTCWSSNSNTAPSKVLLTQLLIKIHECHTLLQINTTCM